MVVYANQFTKTETDGNGDEVERDIPFLQAYTVFCVDQIDGLPEHYYGRPATVPRADRAQRACRRFLRQHRRHRPAWRRQGVLRTLAPTSSRCRRSRVFATPRAYVAVSAHEMRSLDRAGASRQSRSQPLRKDRSERAREELIAELGAASFARISASCPNSSRGRSRELPRVLDGGSVQ